MQQSISIRYKLERYKPGGSNRYTCPHCGRRKCFTRYVEIETGEQVADQCGKCDHESSCGYHYAPRDYFRDHPDASPYRRVTMSRSSYPNVLKPQPAYVPVIVAPRVQTQFFDIAWAQSSTLRPSTFSKWFGTLPFSPEVKQQVLAEYYVGGTKYDISVSGINYGPAVVFWLIDEQQQVHDAKLMAYQTNGHRVANWGNSMRAICKKTGKGPQLDETEKVLFGQHLLAKYPDKTVCIVESEKTALICACHYPQYLWLASGGCGQLQPEKLKPLMDRHVVLYPDSGEYEKWSEQMKKSGHKNYNIADFLEPYQPNTDLADILLGEAKLKEQTVQQPIDPLVAELCQSNPAVSALIDTFGLEVVSVDLIEQPQRHAANQAPQGWLQQNGLK